MKRYKKTNGFTLIELLIVVAIIGILATFTAVNVREKIQNARQKGTMRDMVSITNACTDFAAQNMEAPAAGVQSGPLTTGNEFIKALSPMYLPVCPVNDQWGNAFVVYAGSATANFSGFTSEMIGDEDLIIISYGRKGEEEGFYYDPDNPEAGQFKISAMIDYEKDLIRWNNAWIRYPVTGKVAAGEGE